MSSYFELMLDQATYYMATATSDWSLPTWKFIFNAGSQLHGADGPFLWGAESSKTPVNPVYIHQLTLWIAINNITLANILKDWYLGFAINLDPNSISNSGTPKPYWPQYQSDPSGFRIMDINYPMMGVTQDFDANPRCDFFHGQSYVVRN